MTARLIIARPDDFHVHLRDGAVLRDSVPPLARRFARALVMPNLDPPVTTTAMAASYRERILASVPAQTNFEPLMTLYLTEKTPPSEIERARESGIVHAVKLYPAGATTHSSRGVRDIARVHAVLEQIVRSGLVLAIHGELADPTLDPFDREAKFVDLALAPLVVRYPELKIVLEHISTRAAVHFITACGPNVAATITVHHLLCSRRDLFAGGLSPHLYCRPLLQTEADRSALLAAATSGSPKFFLGSDSAPHPRSAKECPHAAAGIYTGHATLELYAEAFAEVRALPRLEAFASRFGADFYGLARNSQTVTLDETPWTAPAELPLGADSVVPFRGDASIRFRLVA